ncbi:MAG: branched-chain amino acid ABC transporter substrate-binding protein [Comamonadaceae bacterium BICA1-1]|nr:MAG: branched-chain amino acid ABC transporter substrate-binding protein [Comamonadaceae bacterium BICA1-1]
MSHPTRRTVIQGSAAALGALAVAPPLLAQAAPVRIGYSMSRTGPWTVGAQTSQEPNYILWAEQQNAAGGLNVQGVRRPIELIGVDDRSDMETVIRTYERLMGSERVDLVLPPWGSSANFAVAPLANRHGYPFLAPTALSRRLVELRLPFFFLILQQPAAMVGALVDMLRANGVRSLTCIYVDDLFGLENFAALRVALQGSGIEMVDHRSYPLGVRDLAPVLRTMKGRNPDAFVGFTYPPDTVLASRQSREIAFNPRFFYASVGTAFPMFREVMTPTGAEGVMGMGSWNRRSSPGAQAYFEAHVARHNREPDRWASGHTWAALEILSAAVARVGLDRRAIRDFVAGNTHRTIVGDIRFSGSENVGTPGTVGQWQRGEFEVVWPRAVATAALNPNKPAW